VKQAAFEGSRRPSWQRFEAWLLQAEDRRRRLRVGRVDESQAFLVGYTALCQDLSVSRARGYSASLTNYLNDLAVRGHNTIYVRRSGFREAMLAFVWRDFPRLVRGNLSYLMLALAGFVGPAVLIAWTMLDAPEMIYSVMSPEAVARMESMYDPGAAHFGRERASDSDFQMFGFYIWNNISISFQVFATGLLAGIGSLFYLIYNGLVLGAVTTHLVGIGYGSTFLPFVAGHSALELSAIVLAGAAGLKLGHALVAPGESTRREALARQGREAVLIVLGAAMMLVLAAFVEAFWSSTRAAPAMIKYVVGVALWAAVIVYFVALGRDGRGSQ
jgi:uncharacterized membrane protein SpoIIM required for sporulation